MKDKIKEIALQVGGSHYPAVGGDLLQKFADTLIAECIKAVDQTPNHHCVTTWEVNFSETTKLECIEHIKKVLQ
jgi:hypothetical protein